MQANKTVTINGRMYDAVTGLPVETKASKPVVKTPMTKAQAKRASQVPSASVHAAPQRSQTLLRRATKKPGVPKRPKPGVHMDISRSAKVSRFAPHPVAVTIKKADDASDIMPKTHPLAQRAMKKAQKATAPALSSKQVKDIAISAAIAKTPMNRESKEVKTGFRFSRRFAIISACFIVLILAAALTYFNIPSLSVGFASSQAGINATYPEYQPDGFHLKQPVTFSDGEVTLKFASNSNDNGYTITQTRSSWDSSAVLDNVVRKKAGDNYVTTQERGLTIYSFDSTAVWVNGGLLYKIVSNAPLSGEQIRHIATSL
ncbi:MAG: hypothetical protein ABIP50_03605 [Candidatus Saccharimonadales bacterium]